VKTDHFYVAAASSGAFPVADVGIQKASTS
jgi:hypothetical protein